MARPHTGISWAAYRVFLTAALTSLLTVVFMRPTTVHAAGVVGTGTPGSCTEAALDAALAGGGSVTFDCGPDPVTIAITSAKTIAADASIDGGSLITISGGNSVGVFSVNTDVNFTVQNLTIADGDSDEDGGGIYNMGMLVVTNSTFSGNKAGVGGGIANEGTLTVTDSTFSGNQAGAWGGGIVNLGAGRGEGTLTVTDSTFSGNKAGVGGGIYNDIGGGLTVTNSTFVGNTGVSGLGGGGGILNAGTLTVANSTFSGNHAAGGGGGIFNVYPLPPSPEGMLTVTNCTFAGNSAEFGGGVYNLGPPGAFIVINTIIVNSPGGNCVLQDYRELESSGELADGGHNIDDGTTCGFAGAGCASTAGSSFCNTNPQLDPAGLADNGGPTQTIGLEPESSAIDAGDSAVCANPPVDGVDQRGFVRPGPGHTACSIGAYEAAVPSMFTATPTDTPTMTPTATPTQANTATPTHRPTSTRPADTATPTYTPVPTETATQKPSGGGGCTLSVHDSGAGYSLASLLAPVLVLLAARRGRRAERRRGCRDDPWEPSRPCRGDESAHVETFMRAFKRFWLPRDTGLASVPRDAETVKRGGADRCGAARRAGRLTGHGLPDHGGRSARRGVQRRRNRRAGGSHQARG